MGPLPPWNPQPSATTKGGLRPPVWISPQRRLVRSDIAARAPDTPRYRAATSRQTSQFFARRPNGRALAPGGNPKGARRPLFGRRGKGAGEGGIRIAPFSCRRFCLLLPLLAKVSRPRRGETPALVAPAGAELCYQAAKKDSPHTRAVFSVFPVQDCEIFRCQRNR